MPIKYLVCPGRVRSRTDGDTHLITAAQLMWLYCVRQEECLVLGPEDRLIGDLIESGDRGRRINVRNLEVLVPRYDGRYPFFDTESVAAETNYQNAL